MVSFPYHFHQMAGLATLNDFPNSLRLFNAGVNFTVVRMGFFGAPFAFLWVVFGGFICGIIAIFDLANHRRPLVKIHALRTKVFKEGIYGIDMTVSSDTFVSEFGRLYPEAETSKKWWQF